MNTEGGVIFSQQVVSVICVPALVSEFEDGEALFRQKFEKRFKTSEVLMEAGRKLVEDWTELIFKQTNIFKEPLKLGGDIL